MTQSGSHPGRFQTIIFEVTLMAKTQRKLKKANHGKRPASAQARRAKRKNIKT